MDPLFIGLPWKILEVLGLETSTCKASEVWQTLCQTWSLHVYIKMQSKVRMFNVTAADIATSKGPNLPGTTRELSLILLEMSSFKCLTNSGLSPEMQ